LHSKADFCEVLFYNRALTTSERRRVESYLARRWGITLAPQVSNVEAQDWVNRVYANGGTVSTSTANAVSAFCDAIEGAGIRDRFYRLNLFAGSNLNSALVPLFRGPSYSSDGLGSELWSVSTPTISDIGGSSGAWDGSTLTMSNSATGTDGSAPRFLFSLPLTVGKRYTVSGTISGDKSALAYIRLATSSNLTAITYNSTTGAFSGTAVTAATAGIQFLMNGTQGAKSISIDSLSIREVLTYGNATDTNNGPFVSGDYSESTGLQGNQTSKYLNTGLTYDDLSAQALAHLSVWKGAGSVGATLYMAGNIGPSTRNYWLRQNVSTDYIAGNIASGSIPTSSSADTDSGLLTISRQGSSNAASVIYKDTTAIATGTIGTQEVNGNDILIFTIAQANNTPSALGWPFTISAYSVGDGLTSGDLTSYYNALAAFQASLGRS
jgi:hypothetical protein